jgi:hypothetical protein
MKFAAIVDQARVLLQRTGTLTYRVLQREFALDDEALEDLKAQLITAEAVAVDKDGKVLVWTGEEPRAGSTEQRAESREHGACNTQHVPRDRLAEAHKLLSEIYTWFTEGFDTKDLQEAKALIDSLNQT